MTGENQMLSSEIHKDMVAENGRLLLPLLVSVSSSLHPGMKLVTCAGCVVFSIKGYSLGQWEEPHFQQGQ